MATWGIRILPSRAESISRSFASLTSWEILLALEDKNRIPAQPCNILYFITFIKFNEL